MKIAITGMGIISAIGNPVEENFNALISGKMGVTDIENIDTVHKDVIKVGEIKFTNQQLQQQLQLPEHNNFSRTALLATIAAKQAVENAGIKDINEYKTGLISATSVGGMDMSERFYYQYFDDQNSQKYIYTQDAGDTTHNTADYLGLKGLVTSISTACSSAANAIMMGAKLIQSGQLDRVIVGGTDALSKFTINGFKTLMILSDTYNTPFDNNRKGLNLGEAAAFLVLESDEMVKKQNKKVLAYITTAPAKVLELRLLLQLIHHLVHQQQQEMPPVVQQVLLSLQRVVHPGNIAGIQYRLAEHLLPVKQMTFIQLLR